MGPFLGVCLAAAGVADAAEERPAAVDAAEPLALEAVAIIQGWVYWSVNKESEVLSTLSGFGSSSTSLRAGERQVLLEEWQRKGSSLKIFGTLVLSVLRYFST